MTTSSADQPPQRPSPGDLLHDLLRAKNVQPICTVDDLARDDVFTTDGEVDAFIAFTYAERHASS
ncbi:hypothetical protein ACFXPA_22175 [Amycolatopsis sp. NPDC059090]|uniref:hypothetical protein n=1 Tax=unclassified Amycolatopsis TaxID=2618356 RepID=UPI00366F2D53